MNHTVEKIGGTSMSRFGEIMQNVIISDRTPAEMYNRIFVVSAYSGICTAFWMRSTIHFASSRVFFAW